MQLYDLTTTVTEDGEKILSAAGRIADHRETEQQEEWIAFQVAIDMTTARNGALLRKALLEKVRDIADQLARDYEVLGRERQ